MSGAIAGLLPMVETYGVLVTNFTAAILAWVGFGWVELLLYFKLVSGWFIDGFIYFRLLFFTISYGDWMRAVVDVGFSTADNNWTRFIYIPGRCAWRTWKGSTVSRTLFHLRLCSYRALTHWYGKNKKSYWLVHKVGSNLLGRSSIH